ncbi:MAG: hypothetical protein N0C84_00340, partial [Candidatus Thiodiazotropha taylori]|nr:hypothetical protein [Candidatus Thiodiazotropha taylori]MCW4254892.1 hypothetical protein [Candidatus Thiodiazotropha taylori]
AMVTPKDMMLKMHTGAIDKVKIVQRTPCYVNLNRIERYFPRVGSTFCYFIIDETKEETIVELPTGKISANILESSFQYIEHNKVFDFLYKYGNGDKYPFTEATVGKYLLEDKKGIYTNYETQEKCSISSGKKFREHNPVNTKFITPKMTSGKANELFIDYKGEYIWSSNGFYSCILDPDDNPDVIKKNAMIIMEEFKQAFEGVNFKGFVWNNFFKHVAKKHLKEKKID